MTPSLRRLLVALLAALAVGTAAAPAGADPVVVSGGAPPGFECVVTPGLLGGAAVPTDAIACPGKVPPDCNRALAGQGTANGYRCRDHLFETSCEGGTPKRALAGWCEGIRNRRWTVCNHSQTATTQEFQAWCGGEEERRRQLGEPLNDSQTPSPAEPVSPSPTTDPNRPQPANEERTVGVDALSHLGADPFCKRSDLPAELKERCDASGSIHYAYPFSNYGIDNNVEVDVFNGDFWNGDAPLKSAVQWICVQIWQILIWLVKMVLVLLEWAFARDPLGIAMGDLKESLAHIHKSVIGREWTLAALAVAGLWGIWNGLVRMRVIQTIGGLATTVLLMIGALWIIYDPDASVGLLNRTANEASLAVVSAASSGTFDQPGGQFAKGQQGLFEEVIEKPWCALQFANVDYCLADRNKDGFRNIDVWLTFPPGSKERESLYSATKGDKVEDPRDWYTQLYDWVGMHSPREARRKEATRDRARDTAGMRAASFVEKNPEGVRIQGKDGTFTRLGLLALLAFGMLGAILLFLWLGLRLIGAALISLLLLVLAPVMMLAAAFGEEGRSRFTDWLKALVGAVLAKLIYALVLALVLLVSRILADLPLEAGADKSDSGNFLGSWLLQAAFWWTVLVRRDRLLGFISFDAVGERDGIGALSRFHFGYSAVRSVAHDTRRAVTWGPRKALRLGGRATRGVRDSRRDTRAATDAAIASTASGELDQRADAAIRSKREDDFTDASLIMARGQVVEGRLNEIRRDLPTTKGSRRDDLLAERQRLEQALLHHRHDPKTRWAGAVSSRDAAGIRPVTGAQRRAWLEERRGDIATWQGNPDTWDSTSNLHAAGISERDVARAREKGNQAALDALRSKSEQALRRDSGLFTRVSEPLDSWTSIDAAREYRADPEFAHRVAAFRRTIHDERGNGGFGRQRVPTRRRP